MQHCRDICQKVGHNQWMKEEGWEPVVLSLTLICLTQPMTFSESLRFQDGDKMLVASRMVINEKVWESDSG